MIKTMAEAMKNELIDIRRTLHKIPEIGTKEFETSKFIKSKLHEYGIYYKSCYNTGIIAEINPQKRNKTMLLRADIDALPLSEKTGLSFASINPCMMHACGHDFHTTCLLGAAKLLKSISDKIDGRIVFAFQPDEEGNGGALPMIEEGVLNGVQAAVALHIEPLADTGTIQLKNGSVMASPDEFKVFVTGKSGHGACPEECINPISVLSEIVSEYHKIQNSLEDCVVTVCNIHGGTGSPNIIPDTAYIYGTARTVTPETRKAIEISLTETAEKICQKYNAQFSFKFIKSFPPLINNSYMNKLVEKSAHQLGLHTEFLKKCSMTGDDFAYFAERVPSAYFKLGVGGNDNTIRYPLHNSKMNPDENALITGTEILSQTVLNFFTEEY